MTSHCWRTTAATLLNESGLWSEDAIERSLAHRERDAIRGTYNRGNYWDERVRMHHWWSDHLDVLRDGGEVVQLEQERASAGSSGAQVIDLWSRR
jgi:hypothetical protein